MNPPQLISSSFGSEFDPSVSPNGRYLAYTSDISGNEDIWILDLKERERRKVTANTSSDYAPCFLGNDRLVFVSTRANSGGEIYVSGLKGENIRRIIGGEGYFDSPAVSPDRKTIAYIHKKGDENVRIYFFNIKSEATAPGPIGLDPAFAPSGERIVFAKVGDGLVNPGRLALYDLQGDSIQNIETGPGVVSNPAFYPDGRRIILARHTTDSDEDGFVTRNDRPELMIYDLEDTGNVFRFYPGFFFGEPALSPKGQIFAVSDDADIYSLSPDGLAPPLSAALEQIGLCDSLLRHSITQNDTLIAAAGCLSAYNHYPDTCKNYLLVAADLYGALAMTDLALDILKPAIDGDDRELGALATIKAGRIKFSIFRAESGGKAWYDAHRLARDIIESDGLTLKTVKEAYLFGIEISHLSGKLEEGNSLIVEALLRFTGDDEIIAKLEMWRLRNISGAYVGDPMDLVPLYIDYLGRFSGRPALLDSAISDLIELTGTLDDEVAVGKLENIQADYPEHGNLAVAALYEQGERFLKSNQMELAEWKYRAIINDFREFPIFRFLAFERLGDLRLAESDLQVADASFDSARHYLGHIESYSSRLSFQRKFSSLKTMQGYNIMDQDPRKAEMYFRQAIGTNLENYEALWGLAKALARGGGWNRWEDVGRIIADENKKIYFMALKYVTEYEVKQKAALLKRARRLLLKAIEQDYRFPPPYLSLGYVNCLLEDGSKKALGLYEEAVDASLTGVSLAKGNPELMAAFLLNAAEAYYGLGQYRMAYENYIRSMEIDSTQMMDSGEKSLLAKLGESAFQIDSLKEASVHYQELYSQAAAASDGKAQAAYAAKLGVIYQLMGRYLKALEYYETALPYYSSENDHQMMANLTKGAAVCYASFGEDALAAESARRALKYLGQARDHRVAVEDRVKLIIWPFGIEIPTVKLEPMNYGGSIYPKGFSVAADRALLTGLAYGENTNLDAINTNKEILRIFSEGKEERNTGGIRNALGRAYFDMGYLDSAAVAFRKGYRLSIKQDDYIKAYIELINWAVAVLSSARDLSSESHIQNLTELKDESSGLYERIPPTYGPARANLKNIAGVAEFKLSLIKMAAITIETDVDFERWIENLGAETDKYKLSLERCRFLFREGISEVAFGEDPGLAASLSLNEAVLSLAIGDEDGYRTAISRAVEETMLSGSEIIYARAIGLKGLHSEMDLESGRDLITESITSFESLPPGQLMLNEMPLIEKLYSEAIKSAFESGDSLLALGYLERWRKIALLNVLNLHSCDFPEDDLIKAYIEQARRYREELIRLGANQRKLEALGISGQIELKKTKEKKLKLRSQFLDIKEKISEMNSTVLSRLFLDTPSPQIAIRNIPSEEICIMPYRCGDETILWLCDSTGIETVRINVEENNLREIIIAKFRDKKVATIALNDAFGDRLTEPVRRAFPEIDIKHCFSLAEAYGEKRHLPLKLDGVAVVRFNGSIIADSLMKRLGAGYLTPDSLLDSGTAERYGWLVFDGKLYYDRENPLMSYWKYGGISDSVNSESRFYIHDLFGISTASFGAILLDFFEDAEAIDKWAVLRVLFDAGLRTVITIPGSLGDSISLTLIEEFSGNLERLSPLKSFSSTRQVLTETVGSMGGDPEYYGHGGWDPSERENRSVAWYEEFMFAGYQAAIRGNWQKTVEYYTLALRQSRTAGLFPDAGRSISKRLVDGYINLDDYESALNAQMSLIETVAQDTAVLISEWQRYQQIAFDAGELGRSISALQRMIELANLTGDTLLMAKFYLKLAESYYVQNEVLKVFEPAGKAIELSYAARDSLILAAEFNIRGQAYSLSGSFQNAESDINRAVSIYGAIGEADGKYTALLSLGEIYDRTELYISGRAVLKSALKYFTDTDDSQKRRRCLNLLAGNYLKSWQPLAARKYVDIILEEDAGNLDALMLLSDLMHRRGLHDSSYEIGLRTLNIARGRRSSKYVSEAHHNLGNILYSMNNLDLAVDQYQLALEFQSRDSTVDYPDLLMYKLAATRAKEGYNQDSVFMQIREESPDEFIRDLCGYEIGTGMLATGNKKAARELFMKILKSDDNRTARFLKWRLLYNLALASDDGSYETFILQADSVSREYPPEPEFIRDEYVLDINLEDLFYAVADAKLKAGDLEGTIDFHERRFSSKIAALHLSSGIFDNKETELIDDYLQIMEQDPGTSFRVIIADFLSEQPRYGVLWGEPESSVESLRRNLNISQGVIRFYRRPSGMILFYVDGDTISYNIIEVDHEDISKTLRLLPEMLRYQAKADSILEEWYTAMILPFEDLMEKREEILLVPDGAFIQFPLEALKRPDADYLAEMFSLARSVHLPSKFPEEMDRRLMPCFAQSGEGGYDITMGIVNSLSEAVGDCLGREDNFIRFSPDRYSVNGDNLKGAVLCYIRPARFDGDSNWLLETLRARRDGYGGAIQTLWEIPNQALSHYYWIFLDNLRQGKSLGRSHRAAASYVYGRYRGVPYYWAYSAPYNLN